MNGISVVLIARNSEKTMDACLASVKKLADEIVLVDQFSGDRTAEIAAGYGARIFKKELEGFGAQKQFALDQARFDWVFLIDSDETAAPELVEEVRRAASGKSGFSAWRVPRKNHYFGKWLSRGGQYPDYQVRLMKKSSCRFSGDIVHEKVIVEGETGTMEHPILHHSYPDMETWLAKLDRFSSFRAEELYGKGVRPSFLNGVRYCAARPALRFFRRFVLKLGFLDGWEGFMACLHDVLTDILGYWLLRRKPASGTRA